MAQTTYALEMTATAYEGDIYDSRPSQIDGKRNDAGAEVAFGKAVSKSAASDNLGFKLPAAGEVLLGVLVSSLDNERTDTGLASLGMGAILSQGRVWVKVENSVTPASQVLVRIDSGGDGAGSFRGGSAVAASLVAVPNARFLTSAGAGALAVLELNMPAVPALA